MHQTDVAFVFLIITIKPTALGGLQRCGHLSWLYSIPLVSSRILDLICHKVSKSYLIDDVSCVVITQLAKRGVNKACSGNETLMRYMVLFAE